MVPDEIVSNTQIDRRGIERVDPFHEIHAEELLDIDAAHDLDQMLGELCVNGSIACFVRIGQRASGSRHLNTQMVELGRLHPKAGFDVAQTLAIGKLREGHAEELIGAVEIAHATISIVALHDASKRLPRKMIHQLREHQLACEHERDSRHKSRQHCPFRRPSQ